MNLLYFTLIFSLLYSLIEIEVEGKYGWMEKAYSVGVLKTGGKNFTVYHIYMILVLILIYAYLTNLRMDMKSIGRFLFHITLFLLLEDFLWFVFNPHYTLEKYSKDEIWWHADQPWFKGIPLHNITGTLILLLLTVFNTDIFYTDMVKTFAFTLVCIFSAKYYHKFYNSIREDKLDQEDNLNQEEMKQDVIDI